MSAHVCATCGINWPHAVAYRTCPGCSLPTQSDVAAVSDFSWEEAQQRALDLTQSRKWHEEFNALYADRECAKFRAELDALTGVPE